MFSERETENNVKLFKNLNKCHTHTILEINSPSEL